MRWGLVLWLASSAAVAAPACTPTIEQSWVRAAPPGSMMLAGYAVVRNDCSQAVVITGATSKSFAEAMIHETRLENGMSSMRHVEGLPVPARGSVAFAPSGRHLMLMDPARALREGDEVRITLRLADGREISADFPVRKDAP